MKRAIITIDESRCNGCGQCIPNCPEGALQIIDGKARLVSDLFCDGLGACIGHCPQGAISVEEREAEPYDERRVMANIARQGKNVIAAHIAHLREHGETGYLREAIRFLEEKGIIIPESAQNREASASGSSPALRADSSSTFRGCPGSQARDLRHERTAGGAPEQSVSRQPSELRTWPVQLHLVNPGASYFAGADILVAADCAPFAYAAFHNDLLRGKVPIIFCPKLDHAADAYIAKLTAIFRQHEIRSLTVVHMEVPCCSGTTHLVRAALAETGKEIPLHEITVSVAGEILEQRNS